MARVLGAILDAIVAFVAIVVLAHVRAASSSDLLGVACSTALGLVLFRVACARPRWIVLGRYANAVSGLVGILGVLLVAASVETLRLARSTEPGGFTWTEPYALPLVVAGAPIALGVFAASLGLRLAARSGSPWRSVAAVIGVGLLLASVVVGLVLAVVVLMIISPSRPSDRMVPDVVSSQALA